MFDIGFSELLVVFVVALIVLGPERLPIAAKTAGLWIRKIRRSINAVQREINAQLDQEELARKIEQTNQRIKKEGEDVQNAILSGDKLPIEEEDSSSKASVMSEENKLPPQEGIVVAEQHIEAKTKETLAELQTGFNDPASATSAASPSTAEEQQGDSILKEAHSSTANTKEKASTTESTRS
ncbi:Sec-independent protein translocase protein TatB [Marinomonas spartinae]|uniref:Sec-independent protein translocase protein TatB n=1 Tax=Marinomonas spartinae TaxID=1792290 RepID=UPI000808F4F8|nr:Sec-independent protein translocase protein TatB [Marinomonas spartinae]SBS40367.1 Sec-independent protein translocase protein TatB [Marinomonas spartinae]